MTKKAAKTRKPVEIRIGDDDLPEIVDLDAHEEAYLQLREELAQDEGSLIEINRQVGRTSREVEWMEAVPLADYPDLLQLKKMVADTFGAGLYVMKLRHQGRFKKHFQLKIGARVTAPAQQNAGEAGLIKLVQESFAQLTNQLKEVRAPQRDRLEDFVMYTRLAKELNGGGGAMDPWALMDRVEKIAEKRARALIGQELDPPEDEHWIFKALDRVTPVIQEGFAAMQAKAVDARVVPQAAAAQPAAAAPVEPHTTTGAPPMFNVVIQQVLKPYMGLLNFVHAQAVNGNDPETYAAVVLDQLPEAVQVPGMGTVELTNELLIKGLSRPDALDFLVQAYPPAGQCREWYGRFLAAVLSLLVPESPGDGGDQS